MSSRKDPKGRNWEHSRYRDWRPNHLEDESEKRRRRRRSRYDDGRRRGSFVGWLFRFLITVALILAAFGPGGDYVNGLAKADDDACAVRTVVDGDTVLTGGCPGGRELPAEVAGYDAPELFAAGCFAEVKAAMLAGLEIRKALYGADRIVLQSTGATPPAPEPVPDPVPVPEPAAPADEAGEAGAPDATGAPDSAAGDEAATPDEPEADRAPETAPEPSPIAVAGGRLRILVDGRDLAEAMLASGTVQPVGGPGWCE